MELQFHPRNFVTHCTLSAIFNGKTVTTCALVDAEIFAQTKYIHTCPHEPNTIYMRRADTFRSPLLFAAKLRAVTLFRISAIPSIHQTCVRRPSIGCICSLWRTHRRFGRTDRQAAEIWDAFNYFALGQYIVLGTVYYLKTSGISN